MTGGGKVRQVDIELGHDASERIFGRPLNANRHFVRLANKGQFIIRFIGAVVMQIVHNTFRVYFAGVHIQL